MLRTWRRQLRRKHHSDYKKQSLSTKDKSLSVYKRTRGALRVFSLTLKPRSHELRGILVAGPSCFFGLCVRAMRHWLQGDLGVSAMEAQHHVLCYCLSQGTTLLLQSVADDLHLGHLGPSGVKKWKHDIDLLCREPRANGAEAKGH
jgi:hypothetical protein